MNLYGLHTEPLIIASDANTLQLQVTLVNLSILSCVILFAEKVHSSWFNLFSCVDKQRSFII